MVKKRILGTTSIFLVQFDASWAWSTGRSRSLWTSSPRRTASSMVSLEAVQVQEVQVDDSEATSAFGTKEYWDDVYAGRGDFPSDEYSWYYGWETISKYFREHVDGSDKTQGTNGDDQQPNILVPGIGNDPILLDLLNAGYTKITAQDYSEHAIERQQDLLYYYGGNHEIDLYQSDVRVLPEEWTGQFDAILEKGLLDAVYLSGGNNAEQAAQSLVRTLRPGGVFISVSGVVPEDQRKELFKDMEWVRDGSKDLKAGCFIFRKPLQDSVKTSSPSCSH